MTDLMNLDAETGRNIISDDSTPTLELQNTSTGPTHQGGGAVFMSTVSISALVMESDQTYAANATAAPFTISGVSYASGAVIRLINNSSFVSVTTVNIGAAAANTCGAIRVVTPVGTFGWIPVLADAAVTGTVV